MEFEEVSNFIKMGHVDGANLSTPSLHWQQPSVVEPLGNSSSGGGGVAHHGHLTNAKRPNPILGVSRLVNSVRRFKKVKDSNPTWQVIVSPLGTPSTTTTTTPPSTSRPPTPPLQLPNLHEIRYQMKNFVVPADWQSPGDPSLSDQNGPNGVTGLRLIVNLKECIARFKYLLDLEQQKIIACRTDIGDNMDKLRDLNTKIHQLNTRLTLERLERTSHMNETLRTANARIPRLQNLRDRQKRTATKIEGYVKSSNLVKRLYMLEMQTKTTQVEATWARVREWSPMVTIVFFCIFFILVILQFGS